MIRMPDRSDERHPSTWSTPSPEDDVEYLDEVLRKSREAMRTLQEARTLVGELVARAESADGLVRATSDGRGAILDVRLDPRVLRLDPKAVGERLTAVLRAAQQDAMAQARRIVDRTLADTTMPDPPDESYVRRRVEQIAQNLL